MVVVVGAAGEVVEVVEAEVDSVVAVVVEIVDGGSVVGSGSTGLMVCIHEASITILL